jgi:hypothetical protein
MIVIQIYSNTLGKTMTDKSKTSTTLSFRCPHDMLEAIDSIGREHYPTEKNSKTNSGCDRSKALFHIIQAGIAAIADGNIQIEVRHISKTNSKTAGELEELVKKLIGENQVIQHGNTSDDIVRQLIKESISDGDIGGAIANSYAGMMGQFNGLLEELQALQKQVQELKSIPPAPVPKLPTDNTQMTTDNEQLPEQETGNREQVTVDCEDVDQFENELIPFSQIILMLGCRHYMNGRNFTQQDLKNDGIDKNITINKAGIESLLGVKINPKNSTLQRFIGILKIIGCNVKKEGNGYCIVTS